VAKKLWVKICGVTQARDAEAAGRLGADALGLNFYASSPRSTTFSAAREILAAAPGSLEAIGIFVNETVQAMTKTLSGLPRIRRAQWHGDGSPPLTNDLRLLPAFRVGDMDGLLGVSQYMARCREENTVPEAILIDAHGDGTYGGTGSPAPWRLLAEFDPGVPVILAGGLTPENVGEAIRIVRPHGVDTASGVERSPGQKDHERLKHFIENARAAGERFPPRPAHEELDATESISNKER
jgi:phosphoribosylanthranilate isomerase